MSRSWFVLLCWFLGPLLTVHSAAAYEVVGQNRRWFQYPYGSPLTLTYSYQNILGGGLTDPEGQPVADQQIRNALEEAFAVWASVAPLNFVEVPDDGASISTVYSEGQYGTIRIGQHYIDGFGDVKAHAYFPPFSPTISCPICGDIHFDNADRWALDGTLTYPDVLGAAVHEIGHALGLDHTDIPTAVMYPIFPRRSGPGTAALHEDDIAGIQALYGIGVGSVTPLAIPEPNSGMLALGDHVQRYGWGAVTASSLTTGTRWPGR